MLYSVIFCLLLSLQIKAMEDTSGSYKTQSKRQCEELSISLKILKWYLLACKKEQQERSAITFQVPSSNEDGTCGFTTWIPDMFMDYKKEGLTVIVTSKILGEKCEFQNPAKIELDESPLKYIILNAIKEQRSLRLAHSITPKAGRSYTICEAPVYYSDTDTGYIRCRTVTHSEELKKILQSL